MRAARRLVALLALALLAACGGEPAASPGPAGAAGATGATAAAPPEPVASAAAVAPDDLFEDVSATCGVDFVHHPGDARLDNIIEAVGAGACVLDADGDGRLDLYFVDQGWRQGVSDGETPSGRATNRLYRNLGGMRFEDATAAAGVGDEGFGFAAAAGDVDGDGHVDLFVANDGPNRLYRNRGDGTFEDITERAGVAGQACSVGATFFDADQDGDLDLYVANYLELDPDYRLHYAPDVFPGPLAYMAQDDVLYRNDGDGRFTDVTPGSGLDVVPGRSMGVVAFDADGDGRTDVFVANDASPNFLFRNLGGGRFEEIGLEAGVAYGFQGDDTAAMGGVVCDHDLDGRIDLFVTDSAYSALYANLGEARFADRSRPSGVAALSAQWANWGAAWIDADLDGDPDLFAASGDLHRATGRPDLLLENQGGGRFADLAPRGGAAFRRARPARGALAADLDDDGVLDLVVCHIGGAPAILRGRGVPGHHGMGIALASTVGVREGYGSTVVIETGGRRIVCQAHVRTGYLSQGDPRIHVGLGAATRVDRIHVTWPDGVTQELRDVPAGGTVRIVRSEGGP